MNLRKTAVALLVAFSSGGVLVSTGEAGGPRFGGGGGIRSGGGMRSGGGGFRPQMSSRMGSSGARSQIGQRTGGLSSRMPTQHSAARPQLSRPTMSSHGHSASHAPALKSHGSGHSGLKAHAPSSSKKLGGALQQVKSQGSSARPALARGGSSSHGGSSRLGQALQKMQSQKSGGASSHRPGIASGGRSGGHGGSGRLGQALQQIGTRMPSAGASGASAGAAPAMAGGLDLTSFLPPTPAFGAPGDGGSVPAEPLEYTETAAAEEPSTLDLLASQLTDEELAVLIALLSRSTEPPAAEVPAPSDPAPPAEDRISRGYRTFQEASQAAGYRNDGSRAEERRYFDQDGKETVEFIMVTPHR